MAAELPAGVADAQLAGVLKERLLRTEGKQDEHCWIKPRQNVASADEGAIKAATCSTPSGGAQADIAEPDVSPGPIKRCCADAAAGSSPLQNMVQSPRSGPALPEQEIRLPETETITPVPALCPLTGSSAHSDAGDTVATSSTDVKPKRINEDADNLEYEWPFEIVNHFPHEKAVALVEHLREAERQKAQAAGLAARLASDVKKLERELEQASQGSAHLPSAQLPAGSCSAHGGRTVWRRMLSCVCIAAVLALLAALALAFLGKDFSPAITVALAIARSPSAVLSDLASGTWGLQYDLAGHQVPLPQRNEELTLNLRACEAKLQALMPANSTAMRESIEHDPEMIKHMIWEHDVMKGQLSQLWRDIDDAVHNGRNMVCWPIS